VTRGKKTAAWLAVCLGCIVPAEGMRRAVYLDPVGIPTYCFGETQNAHLGDTFTPAQCEALLVERVERDFGPGVDRCIDHPLPANRKAAYTSLAYNVGVERFCSSSVARKENAGDAQGACDAILLYTKAAGIELPGLVTRRLQERALCMRGLM
jgi:lysozyme